LRVVPSLHRRRDKTVTRLEMRRRFYRPSPSAPYDSEYVRLSVCPSVTCYYCVETSETIIKQSVPRGMPYFFTRQKPWRSFKALIPNAGAKYGSDVQTWRLSTSMSPLYLRNGTFPLPLSGGHSSTTLYCGYLCSCVTVDKISSYIKRCAVPLRQ